MKTSNALNYLGITRMQLQYLNTLGKLRCTKIGTRIDWNDEDLNRIKNERLNQQTVLYANADNYEHIKHLLQNESISVINEYVEYSENVFSPNSALSNLLNSAIINSNIRKIIIDVSSLNHDEYKFVVRIITALGKEIDTINLK